MEKILKICLAFIALAVVISCNSTKVVSSWKSPNAAIQPYNKILIIGLMGSKDPELRANVEQRLVEAFRKNGIMATSAYEQYGPKAFDNLNQKNTFQKIKDGGFDGAFTIALLNKTKEKRYNPARVSYEPYGTYYSRFWGQFRTVYNRVYEPAYYTTSTNYALEANFYSLNKDRLQYTAQTKSFDPGSAQSLASDLSETLLKDMMEKGIISKSDN